MSKRERTTESQLSAMGMEMGRKKMEGGNPVTSLGVGLPSIPAVPQWSSLIFWPFMFRLSGKAIGTREELCEPTRPSFPSALWLYTIRSREN